MRFFAPCLFALLVAVSCGGKISDGDAGVDGGDSAACVPLGGACTVSIDCCTGDVCLGNVCTDQPPTCVPDGAKCSASAPCCFGTCQSGICSSKGPPPPTCSPDDAPCNAPSDCCSQLCTDHVCGPLDAGAGCGIGSTKACDQCVATSCCSSMAVCVHATACASWFDCVQTCEQQGESAFACTQGTCGPPTTSEEQTLYVCAQNACGPECTKD